MGFSTLKNSIKRYEIIVLMELVVAVSIIVCVVMENFTVALTICLLGFAITDSSYKERMLNFLVLMVVFYDSNEASVLFNLNTPELMVVSFQLFSVVSALINRKQVLNSKKMSERDHRSSYISVLMKRLDELEKRKGSDVVGRKKAMISPVRYISKNVKDNIHTVSFNKIIKKVIMNNEVLLIGEPGSGKSTLLFNLVRELIDDKGTPIYIDMCEWDGKTDFSEFVKAYFEEYYNFGFGEKSFDKIIGLEGVVLVLDSFDEISKVLHSDSYDDTKDVVNMIMKYVRNFNFIMSSRAYRDPTDILDPKVVIETLPIDFSYVIDLVKEYTHFGEKRLESIGLKEESTKNLINSIKNQYLAMLLSKFVISKNSFPRSLHELFMFEFDDAIKRYYFSGTEISDQKKRWIDRIREQSSYIAVNAIDNKEGLSIRKIDFDNLSSELLETLEMSGLVYKRQEYYYFKHRRILEFLYVEDLVNNSNKVDEMILEVSVSNSDRRDIAIQYCQIVSDVEKRSIFDSLKQNIDSILETDLRKFSRISKSLFAVRFLIAAFGTSSIVKKEFTKLYFKDLNERLSFKEYSYTRKVDKFLNWLNLKPTHKHEYLNQIEYKVFTEMLGLVTSEKLNELVFWGFYCKTPWVIEEIFTKLVFVERIDDRSKDVRARTYKFFESVDPFDLLLNQSKYKISLSISDLFSDCIWYFRLKTLTNPLAHLLGIALLVLMSIEPTFWLKAYFVVFLIVTLFMLYFRTATRQFEGRASYSVNHIFSYAARVSVFTTAVGLIMECVYYQKLNYIPLALMMLVLSVPLYIKYYVTRKSIMRHLPSWAVITISCLSMCLLIPLLEEYENMIMKFNIVILSLFMIIIIKSLYSYIKKRRRDRAYFQELERDSNLTKEKLNNSIDKLETAYYKNRIGTLSNRIRSQTYGEWDNVDFYHDNIGHMWIAINENRLLLAGKHYEDY